MKPTENRPNRQPTEQASTHGIGRRSLLNTFGLVLAPLAPSDLTEPMGDSVSPRPSKLIKLDPASLHGQPPKVKTDERIQHSFSWVTVDDEGAEMLRTLHQRTTHDVDIEGLSIPNLERHWSAISKDPKGVYRSRWSYTTAPRPPGAYSYSVTIDFDRPFTSKQASGEYRTHSGLYRYLGRYEVVRDGETHSMEARDRD